jgi:hypothetical protein
MISVSAMVALEDCTMMVSRVPIKRNSRMEPYPIAVYRFRNSRIPGFSLISGMASFRNCRPMKRMANPMIKPPQFFICGFLENIKRNPKPTRGSAILLMLTLNPRIVISQAVMVVPILAPMITLIDSDRVSREALEKLTTIKVVAEDD